MAGSLTGRFRWGEARETEVPMLCSEAGMVRVQRRTVIG